MIHVWIDFISDSRMLQTNVFTLIYTSRFAFAIFDVITFYRQLKNFIAYTPRLAFLSFYLHGAESKHWDLMPGNLRGRLSPDPRAEVKLYYVFLVLVVGVPAADCKCYGLNTNNG